MRLAQPIPSFHPYEVSLRIGMPLFRFAEKLMNDGGSHRSPWSGFGVATSKLSFSLLAAIACASLLGGQLLASRNLGGISITAWLVFSTSILGTLVLVSDKFLLRGLFKAFKNSLNRFSFFLGVLFFSFATISYFTAPGWDGVQLISSMACLCLIFLASAFFQSSLVLQPLTQVLWMGFFVVTFSLWIASSFYGFPGYLWRDRGEVLVIAAAILPLFFANRFLVMALNALILIATVLTDSRFSAAVMVLVFAITAGFLGPRLDWKSIAMRGTIVGLAGLAVVSILQRTLNLRPTLAALQMGGLETEKILGLETVGSSSSWANQLSSGRTEVWVSLIRSNESARDWLFGHGPGFSSAQGFLVNNSFYHPHNEFVRILIDFGLLGLSSLLMLALIVIKKVISRMSAVRSGASLGAVNLTVVFLSHAAISNPLTSTHFFIPFAFFLGLSFWKPELLNQRPLKLNGQD